MDKPRTSSSSKTASGTRLFTGFFQPRPPENVNLLIQTRGLHSFPVTFFDFSGGQEPHKPGKIEKLGNLQGTPLHRGHRREGAVLLRKRGVGEMSFVIEKVGRIDGAWWRRDRETVTEVWKRQKKNHSPVLITEIHSHGREAETLPQNRVANTARRRSGQKRNMTRGEEFC